MEKQRKEYETKKIFSGFLDERTAMNLHKLFNKGFISVLKGVIKQGKESNVLLGEDKKGKKLAIKVYLIETANFKNMQKYIIGDKRYRKIRLDKQSVISEWCKKEFRNLMIAKKAGISCPEPIAFSENVLVMEFLGEDNPYPRLVDFVMSDPESIYKKVVDNMKKLHKSGLVHGDLSEFNILTDGENIWFIDFSQSLQLNHPNAKEFLERDIKNICKFFSKYTEVDEDKLLKDLKFEEK